MQYAKAVIAAVIAALTAAIPASDNGLSLHDWLGIALAFFVALAAVYTVPNAPAARGR